MKNITLLILFSLLSCQTLKKAQKSAPKTIKVADLSEMYIMNGEEMPINTIVYKDLIRRKKSTKCAQLLAYAQTSLQLLSLRNNNTDFAINDYKSCRAIKQGDSILIHFNFAPFGGGDRVYFTNKRVDLILHNSKFSMNITHASDVRTSIKKNGKYELVPFPTSDIKYTKLELNHATYAIGDTIKGYIKARSVSRQNRNKREIKEILKGGFRVIVEDKTDICK